MNIKLIKIILFFSILFTTISLKLSQKEQHNIQKYKRKQHTIKKNQYTGDIIIPTPQPMTQPAPITTPPQVMTNTPPTLNQPINVTTIPANTITPAVSAPLPINNTDMPIIQKLNSVEAAQLVADIITLQQNYEILSESLAASIKNNVNINNVSIPESIKPRYIYYSTNPSFNPIKQIINVSGESYTNAAPPDALAINPFTNNLVTLSDMAQLTVIKKLYLNNIQIILFALGDIEACTSNVYLIKLYTANPIPTVAGNNAYGGINPVSQLWLSSIDYISKGTLIQEPSLQQQNTVQAPQLASDILALKQNYKTLSETLAYIIQNDVTSISIKPSINTIYTYQSNNSFDPTKQIINENGFGGYSSTPPATRIGINPFTGNPINLSDAPQLIKIKKLYLDSIQLILFSLGNIATNRANIETMKIYTPKEFMYLKAQPPLAYNFNALRPLWELSINYITKGKLAL